MWSLNAVFTVVLLYYTRSIYVGACPECMSLSSVNIILGSLCGILLLIVLAGIIAFSVYKAVSVFSALFVKRTCYFVHAHDESHAYIHKGYECEICTHEMIG